MIKQHINKSKIFIRGNTILRRKSHGYHKVKKESNPALQVAALNWLYKFIYKVSKALYSTLKDGIVRVETINSNGHLKLVDIMSTEGYFLFPYNFLIHFKHCIYYLLIKGEVSLLYPYKTP